VHVKFELGGAIDVKETACECGQISSGSGLGLEQDVVNAEVSCQVLLKHIISCLAELLLASQVGLSSM
jgi:hypothetical protein